MKEGVNLNPKHQYFKLSEDDILGIVYDHLSQQVKFGTFNSRISFVENENNEYRIIAAFGELEDESIGKIDFQELDKTLQFNGERSTMPKQFLFDPTNPEHRAKVQRRIAELDADLKENDKLLPRKIQKIILIILSILITMLIIFLYAGYIL